MHTVHAFNGTLLQLPPSALGCCAVKAIRHLKVCGMYLLNVLSLTLDGWALQSVLASILCSPVYLLLHYPLSPKQPLVTQTNTSLITTWTRLHHHAYTSSSQPLGDIKVL